MSAAVGLEFGSRNAERGKRLLRNERQVQEYICRLWGDDTCYYHLMGGTGGVGGVEPGCGPEPCEERTLRGREAECFLALHRAERRKQFLKLSDFSMREGEVDGVVAMR